MTRIAVDAMGGDYAPRAIVEGAVWGAYEYNVPIELVGREDKILAELDRIKQEGVVFTGNGIFKPRRIKINPEKLDIKVTHASETIEMFIQRTFISINILCTNRITDREIIFVLLP